jgi:galactan endo-1,6-beta-galactosidase
MVASPNIPAWKQIEAFWIDWAPGPESWDWTRDANQVSMLKRAAAAGADRFELFSNSPVWWMLYNHNPSGSPDGSKDNLQSWNIANHSLYLATIAAHASAHWGINFTSIELFNEPIAGWWKADGTQEGCHFDAATQESALSHLPAALVAAGAPAMRVAASDESRIDMAISTWGAFGPSTRAVIDQFNVHGYQEGGDRAGLYDAVVVKGGKILHDSEYGDGDGTGGEMAQSILADFAALHMRAWAYWQIIDVAAGWGMREGAVNADNTDASLGVVNTKWYALTQFSRHIRPGALILSTADGQESMSAAAFDAARNNTLTVIVQNAADVDAVEVLVDLSALKSVPQGPCLAWITSTLSATPMANASHSPIAGLIVDDKKSVALIMPAWSILTLEVQGVSM